MFKMFIKLALPAIFTNVMGFVTYLTNSVFAGRMNDPTKLAAVGLSGTVCGLMVLSVILGINFAQDTLTSQAYGARNLHLCGLYLNRGFFILTVVFIPFALIPCLFGEQILLAIG